VLKEKMLMKKNLKSNFVLIKELENGSGWKLEMINVEMLFNVHHR